MLNVNYNRKFIENKTIDRLLSSEFLCKILVVPFRPSVPHITNSYAINFDSIQKIAYF